MSSQYFYRWFSPIYPVWVVHLNVPQTAAQMRKNFKLRSGGKEFSLQFAPRSHFPLPGFDQNERLEELQELARKTYSLAESHSAWLIAPESQLSPQTLYSVFAFGSEILSQETHGDFRFLGYSCNGRPKFRAGEPVEACDPLTGVQLVFSSPIRAEEIRQHCEIPGLWQKGASREDPYIGDLSTDEGFRQSQKEGLTYSAYLPPLTKARTQFKLQCAAELTDAFGRSLKKPAEVLLTTSPRKPDLHLGQTEGFLEKAIPTDVPVYVTNTSAVRVDYSQRTTQGLVQNRSIDLKLQSVEDIAYAVPLRLREILNGRSGAAWIQLPTFAGGEYRSSGFFQVSPFAIHFKRGHFQSLVWVVDLASGLPVAGAKVSLVRSHRDLSTWNEVVAPLTTDAKGLAVFPGSVVFDPTLAFANGNESRENLFVHVQKNEDMSLLPLRYSYQVQGGIYSYPSRKHSYLKAWGLTPQGIYRAGDKVDYKIFVREENQKSLVAAPIKTYTLRVLNPKDQEVHKVEGIQLSHFGAFTGSFVTAKADPMGWYRFELTADFDNEAGSFATPLRVLITDFTPAPFRVQTDLNQTSFQQGDQLRVMSQASLHSGGPYTKAKVRVNASLEATAWRPERPELKDYDFSCLTSNSNSQLVFEKNGDLDTKGEWPTEGKIEVGGVQCGRVVVVSDVADDRGKNVSALKSAAYFGAPAFVGAKTDRYIYKSGDSVQVNAVVVSPQSQLLVGQAVAVVIEREDVKVARIKGAGNSYLQESKSDWVKVHDCQLKSKSKALNCQVEAKTAGSYRATVTVNAGKEYENRVSVYFWVSGTHQDLSWQASEDRNLKIIADRKIPKVGDTAKFLVQNPYPGAQALVTIERYGVLRQWVQTLNSASQELQVKIEDDFLPGFYLSVVVFSPRVAKPLTNDAVGGVVDLGKPAFRLGYIQVVPEITDASVKVTATVDKPEYKPREIVRAKLKSSLPKGEFTVAVLDEAVFDLLPRGRDHFDIHKGFHRLDGLGVQNFNVLMQLMGQQRFEKKGANQGGDGAGLAMRDLFKFVAYWNPSLMADAQGQAQIEFAVPDNLTGWRIFVLSADSGQRMGLGETTFKVNQPIELRPAMPNILREGDQMQAMFTILNRTPATQNIEVKVEAQGPLVGVSNSIRKTLQVGSFLRETVVLPLQLDFLKMGSPEKVILKIQAVSGSEKDALVHEVPVLRSRTLQTRAKMTRVEKSGEETQAQWPAGMHPDVGNLRITFSPTVVGGLEESFQYMAKYPFSCWEQKLSKAVAAANFLNLRQRIPPSLQWPEPTSTVSAALNEAANFQASNGGMGYYSPRDETVGPFLSAFTLLAFEQLKDHKFTVPPSVHKKLREYNLNLIRRQSFPSFYSKEMASSVRAIALAALARSGDLTKADLERYLPALPEMDLFGRAHFAQAALRTPGANALLTKALQAILGAANETAGKFQLVESTGPEWTRIHTSTLRSQCAILSAFSQAAAEAQHAASLKDLPFKLMRVITESRRSEGFWNGTQENLYCQQAVIDYAKQYEATSPNVSFVGLLNGEKLSQGGFKDFFDKVLSFARPVQPSDVGKSLVVKTTRQGEGALYQQTALTFSPTGYLEPQNLGMEVRREYFVERNGKFSKIDAGEEWAKLAKGELIRVDLRLRLPAPRNYVVLSDPLPAGFEALNAELGTTSQVDAAKNQETVFGVNLWGFSFREYRHDQVNFYSERLDKGDYELSYTAQVIGKGKFTVPPTKAEEMYDADVFGTGTEAKFEVP